MCIENFREGDFHGGGGGGGWGGGGGGVGVADLLTVMYTGISYALLVLMADLLQCFMSLYSH